MAWLTAGLSFLGGLLGAGIPALVALQRLHQDARGEWRERLDQAIALITSDAAGKQRIGEELLADLFGSDLGSASDRALAQRVARVRVLIDDPVPEPDAGTGNSEE